MVIIEFQSRHGECELEFCGRGDHPIDGVGQPHDPVRSTLVWVRRVLASVRARRVGHVADGSGHSSIWNLHLEHRQRRVPACAVSGCMQLTHACSRAQDCRSSTSRFCSILHSNECILTTLLSQLHTTLSICRLPARVLLQILHSSVDLAHLERGVRQRSADWILQRVVGVHAGPLHHRHRVVHLATRRWQRESHGHSQPRSTLRH
jgi:hypothetical protein